jgi:hypothetical protein
MALNLELIFGAKVQMIIEIMSSVSKSFCLIQVNANNILPEKHKGQVNRSDNDCLSLHLTIYTLSNSHQTKDAW